MCYSFVTYYVNHTSLQSSTSFFIKIERRSASLCITVKVKGPGDSAEKFKKGVLMVSWRKRETSWHMDIPSPGFDAHGNKVTASPLEPAFQEKTPITRTGRGRERRTTPLGAKHPSELPWEKRRLRSTACQSSIPCWETIT